MMKLLSPTFLFNVASDEIAEKLGFYVRNPAHYRCHYLNYRALGLSFEANGGVPYVMWGRRENWKVAPYLSSEGNVFWLRTDELDCFVEQVLGKLRRRIVLVTTGADYAPSLYAPAATRTILASDMVAHWYCAQSDIPREVTKHTFVPQGFPYPYRNDISFAPRWRDLSMHRTSVLQPEEFDRQLAAVVGARRPAAERKMMAFADFALNNTSQFSPWGETRAQIAQTLAPTKMVSFIEGRLNQLALYRTYGEYAFVISPFGRGRDCFRTWEALMMGAIPIVKTSPLDPVFDNFPVVIVQDWSEVTPGNLVLWYSRFAQCWDDGEVERRLTHSYWMDQIATMAQSLSW